jgi:hypothetical protein
LDGFGEVSWKQEEFALIWSKSGKIAFEKNKNQGELVGLCLFRGALWIVRLECIDRVQSAVCVHPCTFESVLVEVGPAVVEFTYGTVAF